MGLQNLTPGIAPSPWAFDHRLVDPKWEWFWRGKTAALVPAIDATQFIGYFNDKVTKAGAQAAEMVEPFVGPVGRALDRTGTTGAVRCDVPAGGPLESQNEFRGNERWSACVVFQLHNSAADDRSIISRFDNPSGGGGHRAFLLRTDLQAAPTNIEVYQSDATVRIAGGDVIELLTPYLVVVTCDGANNGTLYTVDLNTQEVVDDGLTGSFPGTAVPAAGQYISMFGRVGNDPWSGSAWAISYHSFDFQRQQVLDLAADCMGPYRPAFRHLAVAPAAGTTIMLASSGVYIKTGVAANTRYNRVVAADFGVYTKTGSAAATLYSRMIDASFGSYTISGVAANTLYSQLIAADIGSYAVTGLAAATAVSTLMAAATGAYTINGVAATTLYSQLIAAGFGSYTLTGLAATTTKSILMAADVGSYAVSGVAAVTLYSQVVVATPGAYTLTGLAANLLLGQVMVADFGTYNKTGVAVVTKYDRLIAAATGAYTVTGVAATTTAASDVVMAAVAGSYLIIGVDAPIRVIIPSTNIQEYTLNLALLLTHELNLKDSDVRDLNMLLLDTFDLTLES